MKKNSKKKLLIAGGTGFLGFHLCKTFVKKFAVISISKKKINKNSKLVKGVKYLQIDISKKIDLKKKNFILKNIDYVVNLSGDVLHQNKSIVYKSHYIGAKNLMNFFIKKKLKLFIQVGSSMEYGKISSPHRENFNKCKPASFYGKAKLKATKHAMDLYLEKKFPVLVLRLYQIYGPYQSNNRLIPYVINKCIQKDFFKCSNGRQKRDFLYISDFLELIKKIFFNTKKNYGQIYNVGYGKSVKVKYIIKKINKKIGSGNAIYGSIKLRKEENFDTYPSIEKIKNEFSWYPKTTIEKGLIKTINFYRQTHKKKETL